MGVAFAFLLILTSNFLRELRPVRLRVNGLSGIIPIVPACPEALRPGEPVPITGSTGITPQTPRLLQSSEKYFQPNPNVFPSHAILDLANPGTPFLGCSRGLPDSDLDFPNPSRICRTHACVS